MTEQRRRSSTLAATAADEAQDIALALSQTSRHSSEADGLLSEPSQEKRSNANGWLGRLGQWRRLVGLLLLLLTVFLWTASNFLASTIFADDSYSKPYFVTYINTATFIFPLIPIFIHEAYRNPDEIKQWPREFIRLFKKKSADPKRSHDEQHGSPYSVDDNGTAESQELLMDDSQQLAGSAKSYASYSASSLSGKISIPETAKLALEFCFLWFAANYFVAACLEYTTVASSTILTSTSSVFTLIFGAIFRVEQFSIKKLIGVLASLAGIIMISSIDLSGSGNDDEHRGDFPEKTMQEIAIGDALAFLSAVFYGIYAVFMKSRIGDETRVNMPLFFGLVGVFNVLLLWPGFLILHFTGVERFEMPDTSFIWIIVISNSIASLVSDMAWAFAVLLTSPIVVTVGLSMTIPLSLFGEMLLNKQTVTLLYWVGAGVVVLSFVFINLDEKHDGSAKLHAADSTSGEDRISRHQEGS